MAQKGQQRKISVYFTDYLYKVFLENSVFARVYFGLDRSKILRKIAPKLNDPSWLLMNGLIDERQYKEHFDLKKRAVKDKKFVEEKQKLGLKRSSDVFSDI